MRSGFIGKIILLALLGAIGYFGFIFYRDSVKLPNANTQKLAKTLPKYPTATTWKEVQFRNVCFFSTDGCSQPIQIHIETPDDWGTLYGYYIKLLPDMGWTTNSSVATSIPTSVIFTRPKDKCKITFENHQDVKYLATVVCPK